MISKIYARQFVCFYTFLGLNHINLGISFDLTSPNIEVHIPFGFLRIGWQGIYKKPALQPTRTFGTRYKV